LGFNITGETPMIGLHGNHINLFIEQGPPLGPVLEETVDGPHVPRVYIKDPFGLIYNLTR
jgi:hypothetical protein